MKSKFVVSMAAASLGTIALGAAGFAFASPVEKAGNKLLHGPTVAGEVTAVSPTSLTAHKSDGTSATFALNGQSEITVARRKGTVAATLLQVGERVVVTTAANAPTTARAVRIKGETVQGRITASGTNVYTLDTILRGLQTVRITDQTRFLQGTTSLTARDFPVGTAVSVAGFPTSKTALSALRLVKLPPRVEGTITSLGPTSFTVLKRDGTTVTVTIDSGTTFNQPLFTATYAAARVGDPVTVSGANTADGSVLAAHVKLDPVSLDGRVTATSPTGFTLTDLDGASWTATVDGNSTIWAGSARGSLRGHLSDVHVGDAVHLEGNVDRPRRITALGLEINPTPKGSG